MEIVKVTKENFDEVVKGQKVLLDFWASWCGPCRMLAPVLEQLSKEENILVGKVNVDEEEELSAAFNISSIPAIFLVENGKVIKKTVWYQPVEALKEFIK